MKKNPSSNYFLLQFVSIKRLDTGDWAIPGVKIKTKLKIKINTFILAYKHVNLF